MSMDLDIGPLSWVKGEIDLALERAGLALAAHEADPAGDNLQKARASMHQAHGALAIVGLDGITEFADAIEKLLAALGDNATPDVGTAVAAAQGGFAALRGYLDDLVAGHPNQPLKLFGSYRAMAVARGQPVPGPADLFFPDLTQRPPKRERDPAPLTLESLTARLKAARLGFERGLLKWIKNDPKGIAEMKVSIAMIEMTRTTPAARAYWWVALGVLDALAAGTARASDSVARIGTGQGEIGAEGAALQQSLAVLGQLARAGLEAQQTFTAGRLVPLRRLRPLLAALGGLSR